jgi:dipeptidase E
MAAGKPHTIHLLGGGPGGILALRKHYHAALAVLAAEDPLVAYVGAASGDNAGFFTMIRGGLAAAGGRMRMVKLASPRAAPSEARQLLEDADLIFVSGGDVELGMKTLHDRDAASTLRRLARGGKPMLGVSAGSIMLAREWVRFADEHDEHGELFACLGIAPVHVDAHDEEDGWGELRALVRLLSKRGDDSPTGYGLMSKGGLRLEVDGDRVEMTPLGTDTPRFVVRHGHVVEASPLPV